MTSPYLQAALYIHVPFCRSRCAYCDFDTYAGLEDLIPAYVAAVCREVKTASEQWGRPIVPTVYFGGGTPSILSPDSVAELLRASRLAFHISCDAEITLEANPGTMTATHLRDLHTLGINRISLGVQSAHDDELDLLGRIHTWTQAVETMEAARAAGFDNLSLDFIFGLPSQTLPHWQGTLEAALALEPEHLSLYGLSVEEGTELEKRIASGKLPPPDQDLAAKMYTLAEEMLAAAGFFHYEISNWAKLESPISTSNLLPRTTSETLSPYACRHNLTYWRNEPWLGVGAAAHSWLGGRRWANTRHPQAYITAIERGNSPVAETEEIDRRLEMGETMLMGLRLAEGVEADSFEARFGETLGKAFGDELAELEELGLVMWNSCVARLTARGRLLGNQVFVRFI